MTCREIAIAATIVAIAGASLPVRADPTLDNTLAARAARLAEHHYKAGEYYRAISSYEELSLFATDDVTRGWSAIRIAMSYHRGHQLRDAIAHYDRVLGLVGDPDVVQAIRIQRALARAERALDEPGSEALDVVVAELEPNTGGRHRDLALFTLARVQLLDGRRGDAARSASLVQGPLQPILTRALAVPPPHRRSPWLGVAMSAVVPGAGSLYGGHLVDGLYYFGLTSLSGLGAWEVHDRSRPWTDQKVTFYGLATLATMFYTLNVLQAYVAVSRRNARRVLEHRHAGWIATDRELPLETLPMPLAR